MSLSPLTPEIDAPDTDATRSLRSFFVALISSDERRNGQDEGWHVCLDELERVLAS